MSLRTLRKRIANIVGWVDGVMGVAIQDTNTGEEIGIRDEERFPMASVCKTPIWSQRTDRPKRALSLWTRVWNSHGKCAVQDAAF